MKNLPLFDRFVTETATLSSTPTYMISISKGTKKRWSDLAHFWDKYPSIFSDVFFSALYHIAWGRYPQKASAPKTLSVLIEEAILQDPDAISAWRRHPSFRSAFSAVSKSCIRGGWIYRFIYCRFYALTIYHNEPNSLVDLATITPRQLRQARKVAAIRHDYHRFKEIIQLLIPSSETWTTSQWLSKTHILTSFKAVHQIDYTGNIEEFDRLITMVKNKLDHTPYYNSLFRFRNLPDSIAEAIWGKDMGKAICKQFNIISRIKPIEHHGPLRYTNISDPQNVVRSWPYKKICEWVKSKEYPVSACVRSDLLNFSLGTHPTTVKKNVSA